MFNKRLKNGSDGDNTTTDGTKRGIELKESRLCIIGIDLNRIELISEEYSRSDFGVNGRSVNLSSIFSDTVLIRNGRMRMGLNSNQFEEIGDMIEICVHVVGVRIQRVMSGGSE